MLGRCRVSLSSLVRVPVSRCGIHTPFSVPAMSLFSSAPLFSRTQLLRILSSPSSLRRLVDIGFGERVVYRIGLRMLVPASVLGSTILYQYSTLEKDYIAEVIQEVDKHFNSESAYEFLRETEEWLSEDLNTPERTQVSEVTQHVKRAFVENQGLPLLVRCIRIPQPDICFLALSASIRFLDRESFVRDLIAAGYFESVVSIVTSPNVLDVHVAHAALVCFSRLAEYQETHVLFEKHANLISVLEEIVRQLPDHRIHYLMCLSRLSRSTVLFSDEFTEIVREKMKVFSHLSYSRTSIFDKVQDGKYFRRISSPTPEIPVRDATDSQSSELTDRILITAPISALCTSIYASMRSRRRLLARSRVDPLLHAAPSSMLHECVTAAARRFGIAALVSSFAVYTVDFLLPEAIDELCDRYSLSFSSARLLATVTSAIHAGCLASMFYFCRFTLLPFVFVCGFRETNLEFIISDGSSKNGSSTSPSSRTL